MSVLPEARRDLITWFESRLAAWAADPTLIGLTPEQVTQLGIRIVTARTAADAQASAYDAARASTPEFHGAADALRSFGGELVKIIKATAESSGDASIYTIAEVPPVAAPTPLPAPQPPSDLAGAITPEGSVLLSWQGTTANGVTYLVERRLVGADGSTSPWSIVGAVQARSYLDEDVPLGLSMAQYRLTAQRDELAALPTAPATVLFGVGGSGGGAGDGAAAAAA